VTKFGESLAKKIFLGKTKTQKELLCDTFNKQVLQKNL
jgi:hypothetical protein